MVRGGLQAYIFSKSPVLERIENDQGFISAVGKQGLISSVPNWPKPRDEDGLRCRATNRCKTACEQSAQLRGRDRFCKPTT